MWLDRLHRAFLALCGKQAILNAPADPAVERARVKATYDALHPGDDRGRGSLWPTLRAATHAELAAALNGRQTMRRAG